MNKKIKTIHLLLLAVLLVSFGCNNDDDQIAVVNLQNLEVAIDENPSNGENIGTIQTSGGSAINFSLASQSPSGALSINSNTGELSIADATLFDFETNPTITASVTADNAENTANITINLNNISEVSAQAFEVSLDENPADGQVIGTLQTTGNASGFSITSQTPAGAMDIDSNTGELTVADASLFDFETNSTLTASVAIEDADNPVSVTVNLVNIVEITAQDFTVSVDENPIDGQVLGTVQASGNSTLDFSITSQSPMGSLAIDAGTGELTVIDPNLFDYETNPVITAEISITDGQETVTATATVNLNNVDEVTAQNTNLTIDENPSNGTIVGTLQASGSNLSYAITYQNPAGAFSIDQSTGELSVADYTLFDFETNPNMLATISVSNGIQSVSANAMVALNDVNEIGEYKFGGVIFWIDPSSNNSEGLVCDINNQGFTSWSCSNYVDTGATGTAIGTGAANTMAIISNSCTSSAGAANLISALDLNGYDDWFLPSKDELTELYLHRNIINATSTSQGGSDLENPASPISLWSSSQSTSDVTKAWGLQFINASENEITKSVILTSRAVRAWTDF